MKKNYTLEIVTFLFVFTILAFVQLKSSRPMLLVERFWAHSGWVEIFMISCYAFFISHKMKSPHESPRWRLRIWIIFSFVFFMQLIIGLLGLPKFLMTGTLHFPIPVLIIAGPIYRAEIGFMILFFISTILLSGSAWCSQLCYFGAFDAIASKGKTPYKPLKNKWNYKLFGLIFIVATAIGLRFFNVPIIIAILLSSLFGIVGIVVILFVSKKQNKMIHCIGYCPIGTIVSFAKFASPFRIKINNDCTQCMKCTSSCKYDALNKIDITNLKPGLTCTYCGDCIQTCHTSSIQYKFWGLSAPNARALYLFITISMHALCLALARI